MAANVTLVVRSAGWWGMDGFGADGFETDDQPYME